MNPANALSLLNQPVVANSCQQDHQHWQQIICQQEEEIRQLRVLLLDVMNQYNCRSLRHSLRHDAVDYDQDLNHLQTKLNRLYRDLIVDCADCPPANHEQACVDTHSGLSATIERHATVLIGEFSRIKAGCLQFLSSMMSLNRL